MALILLPYKAGSESAKALSNELKINRMKIENSKWKNSDKHVVLNWGNSNPPANAKDANFINHPDNVGIASNKIKAFEAMDGKVNIPPFTTDNGVATDWLPDEPKTNAKGVKIPVVVCRQKLTGHSGEGIVLAYCKADIVNAPLYTKYVPKKSEFRIHIMGSSVLDEQRKARRKDVPDENVNWFVRNLDGGFTYMREDIDVPLCVRNEARKAIAAIGLDFGAVDIIFNEQKNEAYVLEVNTAPGLTGTTLEKYVAAIPKMYERKLRMKNAPAGGLKENIVRPCPDFVYKG